MKFTLSSAVKAAIVLVVCAISIEAAPYNYNDNNNNYQTNTPASSYQKPSSTSYTPSNSYQEPASTENEELPPITYNLYKGNYYGTDGSYFEKKGDQYYFKTCKYIDDDAAPAYSCEKENGVEYYSCDRNDKKYTTDKPLDISSAGKAY
ncbi:hypothetical protein BDF19DRAFT_443986 [Syncephalis fuscata]|nr:hypothetical protein BDF19DRAFT_443986 [Syncephalis fuscata]